MAIRLKWLRPMIIVCFRWGDVCLKGGPSLLGLGSCWISGKPKGSRQHTGGSRFALSLGGVDPACGRRRWLSVAAGKNVGCQCREARIRWKEKMLR